MCMKLHRNVFFLENGWRNVGGVMKSFFCNHKKILFEHRRIRAYVLVIFSRPSLDETWLGWFHRNRSDFCTFMVSG